MSTIRKKVLEKNKRARRNSEGLPRASSNKRAMKRVMKDFNKYVQRRMQEDNLKGINELVNKAVSHEDLGLPEEISGHDLMNFLTKEKKQEALTSYEFITMDLSNDEIKEEDLDNILDNNLK